MWEEMMGRGPQLNQKTGGWCTPDGNWARQTVSITGAMRNWVCLAGETRRKNRGWDLQWSLRVKLTRTQGLPCFFYLLKDPLNVEHYCPTFKLFCLILMNLETTPPRTDQHRYDREQLGSQSWILLKLHEIIKHEKTWYLASKLLQFLLLNFLNVNIFCCFLLFAENFSTAWQPSRYVSDSSPCSHDSQLRAFFENRCK